MSVFLPRLALLRLVQETPDLASVASVGDPDRRVEGTGTSTVALYDVGSTATPRNSGNYRRLRIVINADRSRDDDGLPTADDAETNALMVYDKVNPLFHDLANNWHEVFYSARSDGPTLYPIENGDGSVMLTADYEVCLA